MSRILITVGPKVGEFTSLQDVKENFSACLRENNVKSKDLLLIDRQERICDEIEQLVRAEAEGAFPVIAFKKAV